MTANIMMVSADRGVVAGEKGPFHYMLETFSRHWDRVDVIGTRPERIATTHVFDNVRLHHPTTGKLVQAGFIARTGLALAAERPYTVITSHDYNPFYNGLGSWRIAKATGIPYVAEIHHVPGHPRATTIRERVDRVATRAYVRWANKRAAGFRVVNAGELVPLLTGWGVPDERVHVLPSLYLDTQAFRPASTSAAPGFACDVLAVGRLVPSKGFDQLLRAFAGLVNVHGLTGLKLRLVGRGPEQERLLALAAKAGIADNVEHIPWAEDSDALAELYRTARVFVCASASEGGPRVVAEAMACGTPAVSTRVGIVPEIIEHGVNGLLYDGTQGELSLRLLRLLTDEKQELRLRSNLPADFAAMDRDAVIANLADGLKAIGATARSGLPAGMRRGA